MTDEHHEPTPGPNAPVPSWPEFDELRAAVEQYLAHEPPKPQYRDVWRALAVVLGEHQRAAFAEAFDLDEPARRPCVGRLVTGAGECPHRGGDSGERPPHEPPAADHSTLWLDGGEPALYSMHVYPGNIERLDSAEPPHNQWFDLFAFAEHWGLEVSILPKSWYNLGSTVHVVLYPPERYR